MRPRISIRGFVRPWVRGSVRPWVCYVFLKNREFYKIQGNSCKFNKIDDFLQLLATSCWQPAVPLPCSTSLVSMGGSRAAAPIGDEVL